MLMLDDETEPLQPQEQHDANTAAAAAANNNHHHNNADDNNTKDHAFVPYQGKQYSEAAKEIFIPHVLSHQYDGEEHLGKEKIDDDLLWVPQTASVSFRPLCFCVSAGYYVNLLRVRGAGLLSRHRHPGPVHGHVLKGSWQYLEHKWTATAGSYIYEPPGEIHTLVVPDGVEEMVRSRRYRCYSFLSSITIKPCQLLEQCWSLSYCSRRPTSPHCHFFLRLLPPIDYPVPRDRELVIL